MKKLICLILVFSLLLSMSSLVSAKTEEVFEDESIGVVNALDITKETNPDLKITRADFSLMMAKIIGFESLRAEKFVDVPDTYYAAKAIYTLYGMGLVSGKEEGKFYPETEMTVEEAITVMLRFLGYEDLAKAKGGYPTGYTVVASDIGLTKGIKYSYGEILTLKKAARLIENLLETSVFSIIKVSGDGTVSRQASYENTVAKIYFNMNIATDIMNANRHTTLNTPLSSMENTVLIGDKLYKTNNFISDSYLGYSVKVYSDIETDEILYLKKTDKNAVVTFDAKELDDISNNRLYFNEAREYEEIPQSASIIYNNKAITTYKDSYFKIDKGSVTLIDNNNDGDYDVVKILSYKNYVVDSVGGDGTVIRLKDGQGVIDLKNKYTTFKVIDKDGLENPVEMLSSNYVLTVIENEENGYIEIYFLEESVRGTVTGIETGEEYIIYIDNEPHIMSKYFMTNQPQNMKTGVTGMFFVDKFGEIVNYMTMGQGNSGFAYLLNIAEKERESEEISVKLFTQYNEERLIESGKYVTLDGKRDTAISALNILVAGGFKPQLIYYELNAKGVLTLIDTINPDSTVSEITFKELHNSKTKAETYREGSMTFDKDGGDDAIYIGSSCVIFTVPETLSQNAEDYSIVAPTDLQNSGDYVYTAYSRNKDNAEADVLVLPKLTEATFGAYSYVCVIEKIVETVTEDGERVFKITYWHRGTMQAKYTTEYELFKNLHAGDILYIATDINDKIYNFRYLFDFSNKSLIETVRSRTSAHRFTYGYAYDVINTNLFSVSAIAPEGVLDEKNETELHRAATYIYHVTEYPGGMVKVTTGTVNDLREYESFESNYSSVFTHQTYVSDYDLVIYNKQ